MFFLLLAACSAQDTAVSVPALPTERSLVITLASTAPDYDTEAAEAVDAWANKGWPIFYVGRSPPVFDYPIGWAVVDLPGTSFRSDSDGETITGETQWIQIQVLDGLSSCVALCALAHEYGHALGQPHSSNDADVMYQYVTCGLRNIPEAP